MHIARHYRPAVIGVFLTKEMKQYIPFHERMWEIMREKWGYAPEIKMIESDIADPYRKDGNLSPALLDI